ncbi:hypothetical protein SCB71_06260 [Herbiconiux sp. KACC 21604]|uniref:hypothetical protein n=1 Tax=unclassified Herbiconiux TaxID=2618217 RepID=UPI001492F63D|nr:hypothetical protein [Herbiconiux sp. SALV-R1]QJU52921.1 hypothetical protein HL652_04245 [Herbiconiux sp. SALV-R1]WPO87841.1 hypothetical protein SCB71_06260 [Herbiconiux sp. KACC 21604]
MALVSYGTFDMLSDEGAADLVWAEREFAVAIDARILAKGSEIVGSLPGVEAAAAAATTAALTSPTTLSAFGNALGVVSRTTPKKYPFLVPFSDAQKKIGAYWDANWKLRTADGRLASGTDTRAETSSRFPWIVTFADDNKKIGAYFDKNWDLRRADGTLYVQPTDNFAGFVVTGTSTAAGADLTNPSTERYAALLATKWGVPVSVLAQPGSVTEEVNAILGASEFTGTISGGTVPASGSVTVNGFDVFPMRSSATVSSLNVIGIRDDGLRIPGVLTRTTSAAASFTRSTPGTAVAATTLRFISVTGQGYRNFTHFLAMGINDLDKVIAGTLTEDDLKARFLRYVSSVAGEVFVLGVSDAGYADRPGTQMGDLILRLETWFDTTFQSKYVKLRQFIASPRGLALAQTLQPSFTPTTDDVTAANAGTVPPSLRASASSTHLTALGHQVAAVVIDIHAREFSRYAGRLAA